MTLEDWQGIQGNSPVIVTTPNYSGEPSLQSQSLGGVQIDYANRGFVDGLQSLSFQVAIDAVNSSSEGYFGLVSGYPSALVPVAVVGVRDGMVVAGRNIKGAYPIEAIPKATSYPADWVILIANINYNQTTGWIMQVFVDQTEVISTNVTVPQAGSYSGALIETTYGTVYYTNIVVTTFPIAMVIPGYNNMEGYGQGSGLNVNLLPAYSNLTATMTLDDWSVPQDNTLSFQINTMNYTGTTQSTCVGFFQLRCRY